MNVQLTNITFIVVPHAISQSSLSKKLSKFSLFPTFWASWPARWPSSGEMSWNVSQCNSHCPGRWEIYLGEKTREKFRHAWPKHEPWSWLAKEYLRSSAQPLFTQHRKFIALIVNEDHSFWVLVRNWHPSVKLKQLGSWSKHPKIVALCREHCVQVPASHCRL